MSVCIAAWKVVSSRAGICVRTQLRFLVHIATLGRSWFAPIYIGCDIQSKSAKATLAPSRKPGHTEVEFQSIITLMHRLQRVQM